MRVTIEATQQEFDEKRPLLLKALAGPDKPALTPRPTKLRAQGEMLAYWDARYQAVIEQIKGEIDAVLRDG